MSPETWARAKPLLQAALDRSPGPETLADVQADLVSGDAQLWCSETAAVVTQTPGDGSVHVWLAGGSLETFPALFRSCAAWARVQGCDRMTVEGGRRGWTRVLAPLGFTADDDNGLVTRL